MTAGCWSGSRAPPSGWIAAITRVLDQGFAHFEAWRDQVLEQEETERHKLGRKIVMEEDWLRYGVTARRKRNQKRLGDLHALRKKHKEQRGAVGQGEAGSRRGGPVRPAGHGGRGDQQVATATGPWCGIFPPASSAATASASSGRTAPARPRC